MLGRGNPIQESQIDKKIDRAADSFWSAFQMMENGRVKSTLMLYSFCLCWVFAAVYGGAIALLIGPLHTLMNGAPVFLENLVTALVPAVLGTAVCGLTWLLPGDKRKLPAAYLWLTLLMLACLIALGPDSGRFLIPALGILVAGLMLLRPRLEDGSRRKGGEYS